MAGTAVALTAKMERFAEEYALSGNASDAARRAGYKCAKQLGSRLTKVDRIQRFVAEKRLQEAIQQGLRREDIIAGIFAAIATARHQDDPGTVLRGWLAVAKMCGYDKPEELKRVVSAEGERLRAKFADLPLNELLAIAEGRPA